MNAEGRIALDLRRRGAGCRADAVGPGRVRGLPGQGLREQRLRRRDRRTRRQVLTFVAVDAPSGDNTYAVATSHRRRRRAELQLRSRAGSLDRGAPRLRDAVLPVRPVAGGASRRLRRWRPGQREGARVPQELRAVLLRRDGHHRQRPDDRLGGVRRSGPARTTAAGSTPRTRGDLVSVSAAARGSYAVSGLTFAADRLSADLTVTFTGVVRAAAGDHPHRPHLRPAATPDRPRSRRRPRRPRPSPSHRDRRRIRSSPAFLREDPTA